MAYGLARFFAVIGLAAPVTLIFTVFLSDRMPAADKTWGISTEAIGATVSLVSLLLVFVAAIGSAFTILLGWPKERR